MGDVPSKYQLNQDVWVKVDPHTKWMAGKISQILPKPKLCGQSLRWLYILSK